MTRRSPSASGGSDTRRAMTSTLSRVGPASVTGSCPRARSRRVTRASVSSAATCVSSSDAAKTSACTCSSAVSEYAPEIPSSRWAQRPSTRSAVPTTRVTSVIAGAATKRPGSTMMRYRDGASASAARMPRAISAIAGTGSSSADRAARRRGRACRSGCRARARAGASGRACGGWRVPTVRPTIVWLPTWNVNPATRSPSRRQCATRASGIVGQRRRTSTTRSDSASGFGNDSRTSTATSAAARGTSRPRRGCRRRRCGCRGGTRP